MVVLACRIERIEDLIVLSLTRIILYRTSWKHFSVFRTPVIEITVGEIDCSMLNFVTCKSSGLSDVTAISGRP